MKEAKRLAFDTVSVSRLSKPSHKECSECRCITRRSLPAEPFEVSVPVLSQVDLLCQIHAGGVGEGPPLTRVHHGRMAPPRSQDQQATSMPLASRAEFDGTNSFIFNEMITLPLCWLLALDGHLGEGQNVSFTRWGVGGMRVGGRKPGRVSVSLPSPATLSAWTSPSTGSLATSTSDST
jgi:hypothetical protein